MTFGRKAILALANSSFILAACSQVPAYHRPSVVIPASFKEEPGWRQAQPSDDVARGQWWKLFNDPVLDGLEDKVLISNQNLAGSLAAYEQARASVREQRAALFPTIDLSTEATRAGSFGNTAPVISGGSGSTSVITSGSGSSRRYTASIGATWEPDLFGRIRATVAQAGAQAQASKSDLINATLAAQGETALNYLQLRSLDAQKLLLETTLKAYSRALQITQNQYNAGAAARTDILQAETQLRNTRADSADLDRQRAIAEHAIAVLVGANPSTFSIAPTNWDRPVPNIPAVLPASLLERRPDVAAAERRVVAANAAIGIQRSAFFPTIDLSGDVGSNARSLSNLFTASASIWSLGLSGMLTLLDFGARAARVAEARAAYEQAVATYRQTVLTAFQQTEDELAAVRVLKMVGEERVSAAVAAEKAEQLILNQYQAGQVSYTDVITAQANALSSRRSAVISTFDQHNAAVSLIQAIGGNWKP